MTIHVSPGATPETTANLPAGNPPAAASQTITGNSSADPAAISPDFLDERGMLLRLPVSRRTLCVWIANGQIPVVKINGRNLFHWPSVEAALLNFQQKAKK